MIWCQAIIETTSNFTEQKLTEEEHADAYKLASTPTDTYENEDLGS